MNQDNTTLCVLRTCLSLCFFFSSASNLFPQTQHLSKMKGVVTLLSEVAMPTYGSRHSSLGLARAKRCCQNGVATGFRLAAEVENRSACSCQLILQQERRIERKMRVEITAINTELMSIVLKLPTSSVCALCYLRKDLRHACKPRMKP
jgi:hypothetical protein